MISYTGDQQMNHGKSWVCIAGGMILGLAMASPSHAQQTKPAAREAQPSNTKTMKESFDTLEVAVFETDKESQFPAEYLAPLQKEIVKELVDAKAFANVVMAGQGSPTANPRTLLFTGLITNYTAGAGRNVTCRLERAAPRKLIRGSRL